MGEQISSPRAVVCHLCLRNQKFHSIIITDENSATQHESIPRKEEEKSTWLVFRPHLAGYLNHNLPLTSISSCAKQKIGKVWGRRLPCASPATSSPSGFGDPAFFLSNGQSGSREQGNMRLISLPAPTYLLIHSQGRIPIVQMAPCLLPGRHCLFFPCCFVWCCAVLCCAVLCCNPLSLSLSSWA